jgi:hypothetical protein
MKNKFLVKAKLKTKMLLIVILKQDLFPDHFRLTMTVTKIRFKLILHSHTNDSKTFFSWRNETADFDA